MKSHAQSMAIHDPTFLIHVYSRIFQVHLTRWQMTIFGHLGRRAIGSPLTGALAFGSFLHSFTRSMYLQTKTKPLLTTNPPSWNIWRVELVCLPLRPPRLWKLGVQWPNGSVRGPSGERNLPKKMIMRRWTISAFSSYPWVTRKQALKALKTAMRFRSHFKPGNSRRPCWSWRVLASPKTPRRKQALQESKEEKSKIVEKLCGIWHQRPDSYEGKQFFQKTILKQTGPIGSKKKVLVACDIFIFWSKTYACWKIGLLKEHQAGFLRCDDPAEVPWEVKKPWKVVKESLCLPWPIRCLKVSGISCAESAKFMKFHDRFVWSEQKFGTTAQFLTAKLPWDPPGSRISWWFSLYS